MLSTPLLRLNNLRALPGRVGESRLTEPRMKRLYRLLHRFTVGSNRQAYRFGNWPQQLTRPCVLSIWPPDSTILIAFSPLARRNPGFTFATLIS